MGASFYWKWSKKVKACHWCFNLKQIKEIDGVILVKCAKQGWEKLIEPNDIRGRGKKSDLFKTAQNCKDFEGEVYVNKYGKEVKEKYFPS